MKFNNKQNIPHNIDGKIIWEKRSVAVVVVVVLYDNKEPYVLCSRRGKGSPDFQGKMNLVAGYLDWNENGTEAIYRECWEETGLNLPEQLKKYNILANHLEKPWSVNTEPNNNLQNVTLRYGVAMRIKNGDFPILTNEFNEIPGETEDPIWLPLSDINKHEWAFDHLNVIKSYFMEN